MNERRRAVLEGIAYGSDGVTPADRLRALELLDRDGGEPERSFAADLALIPDDELDRILSDFLAPLARDLDERVAEHLAHRTRELERDFAKRVERRARASGQWPT